MSAPVADPLPCGSDGVAVVDRARAGASTAHERGCPHCGARIAEDAAGAAARAALAADERARPVPAGLLPGVMRGVRADLRRARSLPLPSPGGPAEVARHAVAAVVADAVGRLPDLDLRGCTAGPGGAGVTVTLALAVTYGVDVADLADGVRATVRATVRAQFGLTAHPVDVAVVDLLVPEAADAGR